MAQAVTKENLVVAAVLSGNRNFEGRINPQVKANYLASPPLVVAYALAGRMDIDLATDPLGTGTDGKPVYLRDIWPTTAEVDDTVATSIDAGDVPSEYEKAFDGDATGRSCRCRRATSTSGTSLHLHQEAAVLRRTWWIRTTSIARSDGHAGAGAAGRFGHHRPHFAGRFDPARTARPATI